MILSAHCLCYMKTIDVKESIDKYIEQIKEADPINFHNSGLKNFDDDYQTHFLEQNQILSFRINDNMDVGIQISSKKESELKEVMNKTFDPDDLEIFKKVVELEEKLWAMRIMVSTQGKKKDARKVAEIKKLENEIKGLKRKMSQETI